jgi:hypothetical protein
MKLSCLYYLYIVPLHVVLDTNRLSLFCNLLLLLSFFLFVHKTEKKNFLKQKKIAHWGFSFFLFLVSHLSLPSKKFWFFFFTFNTGRKVGQQPPTLHVIVGLTSLVVGGPSLQQFLFLFKGLGDLVVVQKFYVVGSDQRHVPWRKPPPSPRAQTNIGFFQAVIYILFIYTYISIFIFLVILLAY